MNACPICHDDAMTCVSAYDNPASWCGNCGAIVDHNGGEDTAEDARVPVLVGVLRDALLAVEWTQLDDGYDGCADCRRCKRGYATVGHEDYCDLDAALSAAGLPDQASRDEARRAIAERRK